MKKYTAKKPCRFGNTAYIIGDVIPENEIDPSRVKALVKYGVISEDDAPDEPPENRQPEPKSGGKGQQGKKVDK